MKMKLILILSAMTVLLFFGACTTPNASTRRNVEQCVIKDGKVYDAAGNLMTGCVARFDGKMMTMTGRHLTPMKENMRMSNGLVCLVDGTCVMQDRSKRKLEEGEVVTKEGKFLRINGSKASGR